MLSSKQRAIYPSGKDDANRQHCRETLFHKLTQGSSGFHVVSQHSVPVVNALKSTEQDTEALLKTSSRKLVYIVFLKSPKWKPTIKTLGSNQYAVGLRTDGLEYRNICEYICDPMDYSPPGSSRHGISQALILEWVAIPFSRGSSPPRD